MTPKVGKTIWILALVVAAYLLSTAAGWMMHQANPGGVLLYTPGPGDPGNYTSGFYVGFLTALAGLTVLAAGTCLLALILRLALFKWAHAVRFSATAQGAAIIGASTLAGIGAFVLFGTLL